MSVKFTMSISSETFERWETESKKLGLTRNSYISLMVGLGEKHFKISQMKGVS